MKKLKYISLIALALVACKPDVEPGFSDKDAFVSFDKASVSIDENKGSVSIPVTLASIKGIETTISYEAIDSTAKAGTNFELADGAATLTFNAEKRTQYIVVNIKDNPGVFTGDLKFSLSFKSSGDVAVGAENTCVVTISDLDHPLTYLFNTYSANVEKSYFEKSFAWDMWIEKDIDDINKVWINDLDPWHINNGFPAPKSNRYYGIVNEDKTKIIVPTSQKTGVAAAGEDPMMLIGFGDPAASSAESDIIIELSKDGVTLTMPNAWGVCLDSDHEGGWYNLFRGGVVFTKK